MLLNVFFGVGTEACANSRKAHTEQSFVNILCI